MERSPYLERRGLELPSISAGVEQHAKRCAYLTVLTLVSAFAVNYFYQKRRWTIGIGVMGAGLAVWEWRKLTRQMVALQGVANWVFLRENLSTLEQRLPKVQQGATSWEFWRNHFVLTEHTKANSSVPSEVIQALSSDNYAADACLLAGFNQHAKGAATKQLDEPMSNLLVHYVQAIASFKDAAQRLRYNPYDASAYTDWKVAIEQCGYLSYYVVKRKSPPVEFKPTDDAAALVHIQTADALWKLLGISRHD